MDLKKIIIIGATSGIGKEIASIYVAKGWRVALTGRRKNLLEEIKERHPHQIITACFDVRGTDNESQLDRLITELGGLDLLVYNAGLGIPSDPLNREVEKQTTLTNVTGFVDIVSYAFTYFVRQGYGQIAVTSSIAAIRGNSRTPAYSASKAYMSIYAEGLNVMAYKLNKDIVVTDIKPGFINTKMAQGHGQFWVASPQKAARQIVRAIEKRKKVAYITKRWWLIAQILKILPYWLYKYIG
jgi:short-subunit dehydrogenase